MTTCEVGYTPKKPLKKERVKEPEPINIREASALEQAMAEVKESNANAQTKALLLQKYGVTPVQPTDEEQA